MRRFLTSNLIRQLIRQSVIGIGLPKPDFTSSATAIDDDSQQDFAHSLGAKPSLAQVSMICVSDNLGYVASTNDEITLNTMHTGAAAEDRGITIFVDTTNVSIVTSAALNIVSAADFNVAAIDFAKWNYIVRAWL